MPEPSQALQPLDDLLLYRLNRLLAVAGSMVIRLCEGRFGITRREWRLIATLASRGQLGSSQLAEHAQLDRARTSKAIGSLVRKQLVSRTLATGDRRHVALCLTEAGEQLYAELFPLVTRINADLMGALDGASAAAFDRALSLLQAKAERLTAEAVLPKADRQRRRRSEGAAGTAGTRAA
ncbi:DNA-binding transcriptional regulator, MarR family [Burkholderiales bacterium 8X]|nr:DNA-binding transcriptional regulator, MarR family [Burkholderiales bacterium 8X]